MTSLLSHCVWPGYIIWVLTQCMFRLAVLLSDLCPPYEYADVVNIHIQGTVITVGADTVNI